MTEDQSQYITENNKQDKTKLLWFAKRLKDISEELEGLSQEDRKLVIERVDKENSWALKELYENLNDYMGW